MKENEYRLRALLVIGGIVVLALLIGIPVIWGGAIGGLAVMLGDTSWNSGAWLLGAVGLLMVVAVVGLGALMAFGGWRHGAPR